MSLNTKTLHINKQLSHDIRDSHYVTAKREVTATNECGK